MLDMRFLLMMSRIKEQRLRLESHMTLLTQQFLICQKRAELKSKYLVGLLSNDTHEYGFLVRMGQ